MPSTVSQLRTSEHATQAYVLLIDGIPIAWTTDSSGELSGSGPSSFIGRAESDAGETVGGRQIREGLIVPESLEFGNLEDSMGLGRTTARFSVLIESASAPYLMLSSEEPEEMLARLAPAVDPAPPSVVGVTVRDRYVGLERIGPNGERRMFPFLMGEGLSGFDHHGDADGATVPASVSQTPLLHEGRLCALYRVYRDPSAASVFGSLAWPSLSEYRPIWVGKMRDAGTLAAGGRISIETTGFESLLEKNLATVTSGDAFGVTPEPNETAENSQVAIWFGSGKQRQGDNTELSAATYRGRSWTTLSGSTRAELQAALDLLIQNTAIGSGVDYETGESVFETVENASAGINNACQVYIQMDVPMSSPFFWMEMRVAMHRRRWLALGYDPAQQDVSTNSVKEDQTQIEFTKLTSGDAFEPRPSAALMGAVPAPGYYMGVFRTIKLGGNQEFETTGSNGWANDGAPRFYTPLFSGIDLVNVLKAEGGQVLRLAENVALMPQTHLVPEGEIDGTPCDASGWFIIRGKIRKAEGETDAETLAVEDETEQLVIAKCSWVTSNEYFADIGSGVEPAILIERLFDPRHFGYPFRPLDRDWATLELQATQLHSFGTEALKPEPAAQTLSALLRSTGTGESFTSPGSNAGGTVGSFSDIFSAEMGLGIPSSLLPGTSEIVGIMNELPQGYSGALGRCRIGFEKSFPSIQALEALLEPRGIRIGFANGALALYRLRDASPEAASIHILESDLYGEPGDPTTVYPEQDARALAPVDSWTFSYGEDLAFRVEAKDPGAGMRRGSRAPMLSGVGLLPTDYYGSDPQNLPAGMLWKNEAREFFGHIEATFLARRHGKIKLRVSRPKGQDLYPGTVVLVSNPWIWRPDGTQGISSQVGIVVRAVHNLRSATTEAEILVFEGQLRSPPVFAPMLWIESVQNATTLQIASSHDFPAPGSFDGWTRPEWASGGGGNLIAALWRMVPDGRWAKVATAEVASVSASTVNLATTLSALPQDFARTMILVPDDIQNQPEWAREMFSGVGVLGDNTDTRRFL